MYTMDVFPCVLFSSVHNFENVRLSIEYTHSVLSPIPNLKFDVNHKSWSDSMYLA